MNTSKEQSGKIPRTQIIHRESNLKWGGGDKRKQNKTVKVRVFRVSKSVLKRNILGPNSGLSAEHSTDPSSIHLSSFNRHVSNRVHKWNTELISRLNATIKEREGSQKETPGGRDANSTSDACRQRGLYGSVGSSSLYHQYWSSNFKLGQWTSI